MLRPHHVILLASLLADGGTQAQSPKPSAIDGGTGSPNQGPPQPDAGSAAPSIQGPQPIRWPENPAPLATLGGPAILALNAVLQHTLTHVPKEYAGTCYYSAKALELTVSEEGGVYFVHLERRADKCGWAPGTNLEFDGFEWYAVSPEGRILARYPYAP